MRKLLLFYIIFFLNIAAGTAQTINSSNLKYVDPTIGGVGLILKPTRPTMHLPNSLIRVHPVRNDQLDDQVAYFPLTVTSHRVSSVFAFMGYSGEVKDESWNKRTTTAAEEITPYFYKTTLEEDNSTIAFIPSAKSGYFRLKFEGNNDHHIRLGIVNKVGAVEVKGKRVITGTDEFSGMKAYLYAEVDQDIIETRYKKSGAKVSLMAKIGNKPLTVNFKYGISYISIEQAKQNLEKEIVGWDFELIKNKAYKIWDKALSSIKIEGGTLSQKRVFYTALYRSFERMVDINEYGKYYSGFDHKVHQSDQPFFVDNWIWDNYIALEPLHMILNPVQEVQKINSYIKMYEQGGWMPSFALVNGDWKAMTGNHAATWIADAWFKGLRNFDVKKAYAGLKKNSLEATLLPWNNGPLTSLDTFYHKNGYMPGLKPDDVETVKEVDAKWEKRQSVSVTLENSYSDWCIAQLAAPAGHQVDTALFLKMAGNYKHVFRKDKGFMWPKDADGNWIEPYDPKLAGREYFTENNGYIYNWDVKHDLKGLIALMGGRKKAEEKLDQLFREEAGIPKYRYWYVQPDASGLVGQFAMGNEPSFHIPYLYNYTGAPWKTQKRMRMLLDTWFTDNVFGIPGDEDGGGMSAYVVFSMMGFFQVTPGIPIYTIASPVFNHISMKLPNGKQFVINAINSSPSNKYIQSAKLNGKPLTKCWFTHQELIAGAVIELVMGSQPNREWGSNLKDMPPSSLDYKPGIH